MSGRRHFQMPTPPGVADFHSAGADAAGLWETHRPDERLVPSHCSFCGVQCGMHLRVAGGDVIGVEPRMDTHNRGKLCPKGVGAYQQISHPDRLTFPLVRDSDGLRRATWDEALDRVVDGIRRIQVAHGPDAVATYGGASTVTEKTYVLGKFARLALGTRHADYNGRMCMVSAGTANMASFGVDRTPNPISDMAHADAAIVLGANVPESFPIFVRHYWELLDCGGTLIVADPRETTLARVATMHLALRPGTDAALLMALLHEVIARDLIDHDFIAAHTVGFDAVAASVADWTANRAAAICGVPAADITEAAVRYGSAPRAMVPVVFLAGVDAYPALLLGGFVLGLGGASFAIGVPFVNPWVRPERRGVALGVYGAGNIGTAVSGFVSPRISDSIGQPWAFFLVAVALAVMGTLFCSSAVRRRGGRPPPSPSVCASGARRACRSPAIWHCCTP
jgi:assimilatory nitrate reductase catalytic subunit